MVSRILTFLCLLAAPWPALAQPRVSLRMRDHDAPLPNGAVARVGSSPFALSGNFNAVVLSPDGKRVAGGVFPIAIYDADTGELLRQIASTGGNTISRLEWSRDSQHLLMIRNGFVSPDVDHSQIWNATTGKPLWDTPVKLPASRSVALIRFIAKDKLVAFVHYGPHVDVLDVATGKTRYSWTVDPNRQKQLDTLGAGFKAWQVALSPSGEQMAWLAIEPKGDAGSGVLVYETASGKLLHTVKGLPYTTAIDLLDEKTLVLHPVHARPGDKFSPRYTVLDLADGRTRYHCEYRGVPPMYHNTIVSDGWSLAKPIYASGNAIAIHRDALFTHDRLGMIRWDYATGKKLDVWDQQFRFSVTADGKRMLVRSGVTARIVDGDVEALRTNTHFWEGGGFPRIRYQPDGRLWAEDGERIHLWDPRTKTMAMSRVPRERPLPLLRETYAHLEGVVETEGIYPETSADSKRVVLGVKDGTEMLVRWFDNATGKELGRHRLPAGAWFPHYYPKWYTDDGTVFGYLTRDSQLVRVECATGKVLPPIGVPVPFEALKPSGVPEWRYSQTCPRFILAMRQLPAARREGQEYLVLDKGGALVRQFHLFVFAYQYNLKGQVSPDGRVVAVSYPLSSNLRLHETATGGLIASIELSGHVSSYTFSPDGKFLATAPPSPMKA